MYQKLVILCYKIKKKSICLYFFIINPLFYLTSIGKVYYSITMNKPNYSNVSPIYVPVKRTLKASIKKSSPYPNAVAAFNWLNVGYPYLHTHTHWEILVVIKGTLKHTLNGHQEPCSAGYACLIRPTDHHRLDCVDNDREIECINFTFSNESAMAIFGLYQKEFESLPISTPLHFFLDPSLLDSITKQALAAQSTQKDTYEKLSLLIVHQLVLALFSQRVNLNDTYPEWLNDFLNFLHNPECFRMSTKELATHSPYSYPHLSRIFKQYLGKTLVEHLTDLKIMYAKRLLRTTNKSVLDISLDLGYDSVSSFNHNFKSATNSTPLQYRKNAQKNRNG